MLQQFLNPAQKFISDNATTLLTAVGVTGTVSTGVLGFRAGYKSAVKLDNEYHQRVADLDVKNDETSKNPTMTTAEKVQFVWPELLAPIGSGALTIGAILFSHKMNAGRAATLAAAYSASKSKYEDYRDKVADKIGVDEEEAINKEVEFVYMDGEALFLDQMTGRYFKSSMLDIKTAENTVNHEILTHGFASLGMFYDEIGIPSTDVTEDLGWNSDMLVEVHLGSEITPEGKPAIVLSFVTVPKHDYR